jgi:hypothetical protein
MAQDVDSADAHRGNGRIADAQRVSKPHGRDASDLKTRLNYVGARELADIRAGQECHGAGALQLY